MTEYKRSIVMTEEVRAAHYVGPNCFKFILTIRGNNQIWGGALLVWNLSAGFLRDVV